MFQDPTSPDDSASSIEISIVCPVYHGELSINLLVERIIKSITPITSNFEILLINDGSPDHSWQKIQALIAKIPQVIGINLSRNFGQHAAISAGLSQAKGTWIVVMDCDLQDQPEEISRLYSKALEGFDIVLARRTFRKDSLLTILRSWCFYKVLSFLTDTKFDHTIANFGIYNRKVIKSLELLGDRVRFFPGFIQWVGFRSTSIIVEHSARAHGETSYTFSKLTGLAGNIILAFSDKPLRISIYTGLCISACSIVMGIWLLIKWYLGQTLILGWTSIMISLWFLSGLIITIIGISGLYIGRILEQTKMRPIFIISEIIRHDT